jgi:phosphopantetheinyl transferase
MKWILKEIEPADMVRVPSGGLYHYGICVDENTIVQFGESVINPYADPKTVKVNATTIDDFLRGRFAEVAEYDKKELKRKNSPEKIISYAKSAVGRGGYHILHNNCEHFANECIFNDHKCTQTDDFRMTFGKSFPMIDVYIASVSRFSSFNDLPKYAKKELKATKNEALANQKRSAYGLLEYAVQNSFKQSLNLKSMFKDERGKPHMGEYCFSISHTNELVCVAVSRENVGVDIEELKFHPTLEKAKERILNENEHETVLSDEEALTLWTKKEAIYKFNDSIKSFIPKEIDTTKYQTKSQRIIFEDKEFLLSVSANSVINVNILTIDGKKAT